MMLSQFHDGFFNGLLINGESVCVFISTVDNERFALHAAGVVALLSEEIKAGNVILDVQIRSAEEIDREDVREVHGFPKTEQGDEWAESGLRSARTAGLSLMTLDPSYGGRCVVLGRTFALIREYERVARLEGDANHRRTSERDDLLLKARSGSMQAIPTSITMISPSYGKILGQALAAEQAGLDEVVGIALRRSLEVLVKDYAVSVAKTPEAAYSASKSTVNEFLRRVLKGEISEKALALMDWLGDDAFDYERRWRGENIAKLKTAIKVIEQVIATAIEVNSVQLNPKPDESS